MVDKKLKRYARQAINKISKTRWKRLMREYYVRLEESDIKEKEILEEFFKNTVLSIIERKQNILPPEMEEYAKLCR